MPATSSSVRVLFTFPGLPITSERGGTIVPGDSNDPAATNAALKFFAWAFAKGGKMAEQLDYVPMPGKVVGAVQNLWAAQIKDPSGKPVYAISR